MAHTGPNSALRASEERHFSRRFIFCTWLGLIWPEMTPATSLAAAKVRASSGSLIQRKLRSVLSCYNIYAST